MRHPTEATLRRLLEEPAGVAEADREHVAGCPACLSDLAAVQQGDSVTGPAPDDDRATAGRWRAALRRPVVAAVGVAALLAGGSAAAAADWFQVFRTEQIAPVAISEADLVQLPEVSAYGDVDVVEEPHIREVASAAAAEEATGLSVPRVGELPAGVTEEARFRVAGPVEAVFTFSAEKAARTAEAAGQALPPTPPGLDGSSFRLTAGPAVAAVWPSAQGAPALLVGRAVAPTAYSPDLPFETARDYLLSLPGLPADVADRLRTLSADGTTLPLPLPAGEVTSTTADINGHPATVLTTRTATMSAVVWVHRGTVTAVAGSLSADEVVSVARALEPR